MNTSNLDDSINTLRVLTMTVHSSTPQMCAPASRSPSAGPPGEDGINADEKPAVIPLLSHSRRSRSPSSNQARAA